MSLSARGRAARAIVRPGLNRLPVTITFPDGSTWGAGGPEMLLVRPDSFFERLGRESRTGFGEAYVAGDWTTGPDTDLADLITPFAEHIGELVPPAVQKLKAFVERHQPDRDRNTVEGSRSNIERHYDLSNEMFALFLDPSMTYSCAWFSDADEPLEDAQLRKIDGILDQAHVTAGTRLLEIGTGWGTLAMRAAARGASVTTVTISQQQANLAKERFAEAGVDIDLRVEDYRDIQGEFDAIVSVEMIEAVGQEFWPAYFGKIDELLAPGGALSIQSILMPHERLLASAGSYGWIQKYIFPGGLLPSTEAIDEVLAEHTGLVVSERRHLGPHYAVTLRRWREKFDANWSAIERLGFDAEFQRIWDFYLAYCEASFVSGYTTDDQLQLTRRLSA